MALQLGPGTQATLLSCDMARCGGFAGPGTRVQAYQSACLFASLSRPCAVMVQVPKGLREADVADVLKKIQVSAGGGKMKVGAAL